MRAELIYRGYLPGDESQILSLMRPYWKDIKDLCDWTHEFIDGPDGPCISRICEIDGQIIGHMGLIMMQMTVFDKDVLAGKAEGLVVSEGYRKTSPRLAHLPSEDRCIFLRLSRNVWEEGLAHNVGIMWGFPNKMALGGHLRAGWESWALHCQTFIRPISTVGSARLLAKRVLRRNLSAPVAWISAAPLWLVTRHLRPLNRRQNNNVVPIREFDERIDRFWHCLAERHQMISINRTHRHLNWRFAHEPYVRVALIFDGQLKGYAVGLLRDKKELRELLIVDLVIDEGLFSSLDQVFGGLVEAVDSKVDCITINCFSHGCAYGERLNIELKKFFIPVTRIHSIKSILKVNPLCCDDGRTKNSANWFINDLFRELF